MRDFTQMNMKNAAYSEEYMLSRKITEDRLFKQENKSSTNKKELNSGIYYVEECYCIFNNNSVESGAKVTLFKENVNIYDFICINEELLFCQHIDHSNGKEYIVFNRDLYGYSVLEIDTMRDFHYFPKESVNTDGEFEGETFIWTEIFYNEKNNFIAVCGCFWGCCYEYILIDFSDPFTLMPYLYIFDIIDEDDFYFSFQDKDNCWKDKDFVCNDRKSNKTIIIKESQYLIEYNKLS